MSLSTQQVDSVSPVKKATEILAAITKARIQNSKTKYQRRTEKITHSPRTEVTRTTRISTRQATEKSHALREFKFVVPALKPGRVFTMPIWAIYGTLNH